jgi:hypothetical protein
MLLVHIFVTYGNLIREVFHIWLVQEHNYCTYWICIPDGIAIVYMDGYFEEGKNID